MVVGANNIGMNAANAAQAVSGRSSWFGPKVKRAELVDMTSQMAIMTRAGVDMASALESLVRQCTSPALRPILEEVHESVLSGNSVSESMAKYGHVFDATFVASVSAGEASGRLPEVLRQLSELLRNDMRLRNSVRTMLAYPILLSVVSSTVLLALILFVLPRFAEIFADFDAPLPVVTQFLISVSSELRMRFWFWVPLLVGGFTGAYFFKRSVTGRLMWDRFSLSAPILSGVTRSLLIGRVCRLLGIMIDSGVPLLDGLRLARSSVKNSLYVDLFVQLEDDVMNGRGLASALLASDFVPGSAGEMVVTAEKTGTLGMVTGMIGQHYEEEGEAKLKEVVAFMEPVITVVMGALVAIIVMAVMLPLFDLSSVAKG
ncbi:MAG: type II secretion system F family protein [Planctomycetes bacterium]|nr:type II secretion system F family protein [Planctomycetota bacterium]